ncbi:MAG: ribonuclease P protein component [bacterium]|nr:ribonuclease P protein component [bacterium]
MLPEANRLKSNDDFKKIFEYGKISENEFMRIKFLKNFKKRSRFGFIVSNKFAPKAVVRNLFKRRLRAAAYFLLKNIKPGFDVVIWPKITLKKINYQMLLNNFKNLLIKNDILSI